MARYSHDVFISHASEDKESVARPLARALTDSGWTAWLDELEMTIGDSLSRRIDEALSRSQFGVVVLSPSFFAKHWPQRELAGLAAREADSGTKVILPVWHRVTRGDIVQFSPTLADRLGAPTSDGIDSVAGQIIQALEKATGTSVVRAKVTAAELGRLGAGAPPTLVEESSPWEPIGRNDPCWCGSGKKFKKCHGA
ncbi:MAG TPA: TIR domain-containing protein [Solirubrobacterales bacterium]|jgi:hypothetical protein|nr:TIR domain-containing protein [Solirubrobacterales bacterium]